MKTMNKNDIRYQAYIDILKEELIPAMGCTEPIALAYAAATARELLGCMPERVEIGASGSIIKNVKSVIVPNTGHLKGIPAAAAAGIVAGDANKQLEVISHVTLDQEAQIRAFLEQVPIEVEHVDNQIIFDIIVTLYHGNDSSMVRIANYHTNIVHKEKNGEILLDLPIEEEKEENLTDRTLLSMEGIWDFINTVDVSEIQEVLNRQADFNMKIAQEGINGNYGANIGKVLLDSCGPDVQTRAKAMAAAGSDARMNGCELPVIINSGSGNQGITVSVPVRQRIRGRPGKNSSCSGSLQPLLHSSENQNRTVIRLLRCSQCRFWRRGRYRLSLRRRVQGDRPYSRQCPCHCVRYCL